MQNQLNSYKVTVIIPVYNGAGFITDTMESVKHQTHPKWECIVVDDGSTDTTAAVVKNWMAGDTRFRYIYQTNKGLSGARNTGLQNAQGSFIQFLDADDVILPLKLEKQLKCLEGIVPDAMIVSYTDYQAGTSADIYRPSPYYVSSAFNSNEHEVELIQRWETTLSIPPNCFLFSANIFKEAQIRFDESIPNHEDFDCWLTILHLRPQVHFLNEKLCIYRVTDGSMSKKMKPMGEGFLQVLNKRIHSGNYSQQIKKLLIKKRLQVLQRYRRFDLMSWSDKINSLDTFWDYYSKRILQKTGLKP